MITINKRQLKNLLVVLAVAKDKLKDARNSYLADRLYIELNKKLEEENNDK